MVTQSEISSDTGDPRQLLERCAVSLAELRMKMGGADLVGTGVTVAGTAGAAESIRGHSSDILMPYLVHI